jgi:predicted nucleotidyltransferase/HEPN domain-containing protein
MMLERALGSKVAIKTLRALLRQPYRERFFRELVKEAGVGVGPLNDVLKGLVAEGVVKERVVGKQHFYKVDLESPLAERLFEIFVLERKAAIPANLRTALDEMVGKLRAQSGENLLSALLFGSVATNKAKPESDLDLLLVFENSPKQMGEIRSQLDSVSKFHRVLVQEHLFAKSEFLEAYALGDDLVVNALADGLVLYDDRFLTPFLSQPLPKPSSAVATQNLEGARRKIEDARRNYREGSLDTAIMLLGLAMSMAARGYLILKGETPASRHDLVFQLRKYSHASARLLENLSRARETAAHASTTLRKEAVWSMLKGCEEFVRQALEESGRLP